MDLLKRLKQLDDIRKNKLKDPEFAKKVEELEKDIKKEEEIKKGKKY
ncbi:hypothetical protein WAX88_01250 [Photobacterium damselae subsp. damselae]